MEVREAYLKKAESVTKRMLLILFDRLMKGLGHRLDIVFHMISRLVLYGPRHNYSQY